jgi:transcriptional regulator with XRE-family HTH domain
MTSISPNLQALGARLRDERLKRNETQAKFAARLGISVPTLAKMESGHPGAMIGHWVKALIILDHIEDVDKILAGSEDLFAKYDKANTPARKRASTSRETP